MSIVSPIQLSEWLRIDPNKDIATINMLVSSAVDVIEHETGRKLRTYTDPDTEQEVIPVVPESLKHAVAIFVSAHFDDRSGDTSAAMVTLRRLCAPFREPRL